jgi:hypothetical protein
MAKRTAQALAAAMLAAALICGAACGPGGLVTSRPTTRTTATTPATTAATKTSTTIKTTPLATTTTASKTTAVTSKTTTTAPFDAAKYLQAFLAASSRHCKFHYEAFVAGQASPAEVLEFETWSKPGAIRMDQYKSGVLDRTTIVTPEAAKVYFHSSKNVSDALMPAAYYLELWTQDYAKASVSGGVFSFAVNIFYKRSSATHGYYMTDVKYTFSAAGVMTQTYYGNSSSGSKPSALNSVVHTFSLVELKDIPDSVFAKPF